MLDAQATTISADYFEQNAKLEFVSFDDLNDVLKLEVNVPSVEYLIDVLLNTNRSNPTEYLVKACENDVIDSTVLISSKRLQQFVYTQTKAAYDSLWLAERLADEERVFEFDDKHFIVQYSERGEPEKFYEIRLIENEGSIYNEISADELATHQEHAEEMEATAGGWIPRKD